MTLAGQVARRLDALAPAGARCLVAVSGGPDSTALLDLLRLGQAIHGRELVVGHVDHGISAASGAVAAEVERLALASNGSLPPLPFFIRRLALGPGTSETVARRVRRAALREMTLEAGADCVVLAHHADDQAETVLLRLLRGSGPAGLAGMTPRRGIWIRPVLDVPREVLGRHLAERGIPAWSDPANEDPRHLRSWLRSEVMPQLRTRLPDLRECLLTTSRHAAAARRGWDDLPDVLPELSLQQEKHGISVAALPLAGYSSALRRALLGTFGRRFGVSLGRRRIGMIEQLLRSGGGKADLSGRLEVELAFGRLIFRRPASSELPPMPLADGTEWDGRRFTVRDGTAGAVQRDGWSTWLMPGDHHLRPWRPGDRIRPLGGRGARPVRLLLKEARIAPGRRPAWPVVTGADDATILWVPGICRSEAMVPEEGAVAIHVECTESRDGPGAS